MLGLTSRYVFKGDLHLLTAMHIGGARGTLSPSDSPVLRTPEGHPFIPGSSFKGAFRSTVEKLAGTIGIRSCGLSDTADCIGPHGDAYKAFNKGRNAAESERGAWNEQRLLQEIDGKICETCLLFGSQFMASKIQFHDLYLSDQADVIVQIRDGVAIDRDSEKAADKLKFDYEVVPASYAFRVEIYLADPTPLQLGLVCAGLSEYTSGFGQIGGHRSRGLGKCELRDLKVFKLDLREDKAVRLRKYLQGQTIEEKMELAADSKVFLEGGIDCLLRG